MDNRDLYLFKVIFLPETTVKTYCHSGAKHQSSHPDQPQPPHIPHTSPLAVKAADATVQQAVRNTHRKVLSAPVIPHSVSWALQFNAYNTILRK